MKILRLIRTLHYCYYYYLLPSILAILSHLSQSQSIELRLISSINIPYHYEADNITGLYGIEQFAVKPSAYGAYDANTGLVYTADKFVV